jgi:protein-disulfide isomerase
MAGNSGAGAIAAALVLGVALVVGSLVLKSGLDAQSEAIAGVQAAIVELKDATRAGGAARPTAAAPRRGPDPAERHAVSLDGAPVRGPASAKVTLVEFMDFQCPFCSRVQATLDQIQKAYGDQVRIVFKHMPLGIHANAPGAAAAAEAAHRQGRFWEMHDRLFANQRELSDERYQAYARELGLDLERFDRDRASAEVKGRIDQDEQEAARLGVSGTPAFFINGRFFSGAQPFEAFKAEIDRELAAQG